MHEPRRNRAGAQLVRRAGSPEGIEAQVSSLEACPLWIGCDPEIRSPRRALDPGVARDLPAREAEPTHAALVARSGRTRTLP